MRDKYSSYIILITILIGVLIIFLWSKAETSRVFQLSVPGMDSIPKNDAAKIQIVNIGEHFKSFEITKSSLNGKWPKFRGYDGDNIVKDGIKLINSFGSAGPKINWEVDLGEGHASPVIYNGKVYILDYLEEEKKDALRCFDLETGKEEWRRSYDVHIKRNHGMSRTIPAVSDDYLLSLGPLGHVMCLNPKDGGLFWTLDLVKEYGVKIPFWYTGQCPIIENGTAILATGGNALLIGVDCATGKVIWETPNPKGYQMSHSSIVKMQLGSRKTYVYAAIGAVVGISGEESNIGELLWENKKFAPSVVAPSPLPLGNGNLFVTAGYGAGSILLNINEKDMSVKVVEKYKPKKGLASEQQTPILIGNKVYGVLPKDAGALRNQFVCYSIKDLKKPLWSSGKSNRFGLGPYILADNKFFIVADNGTLSIAKVGRGSFELLDQYRVIEGHDAWGPIAIADGYLLMRDSKRMLCLNIRK